MIERGDLVGMVSPLLRDITGTVVAIREEAAGRAVSLHIRWEHIPGIRGPVPFTVAESEVRLIRKHEQAA